MMMRIILLRNNNSLNSRKCDQFHPLNTEPSVCLLSLFIDFIKLFYRFIVVVIFFFYPSVLRHAVFHTEPLATLDNLKSNELK